MDINKITDRLNAIKRTLLFSNSIDEFADKVGIPSLANNNNFDKVGIDKRIAIYESLKEEYKVYMESSDANLDDIINSYEFTSEFYTNNELAKIPSLSTKENILKLMESIFVTHNLTDDKKLNKFLTKIYNPEIDRLKLPNLDLAILFLLLYKVIPTYKSKRGIVPNIEDDYEKVCDLLCEFHNRHSNSEENLRKKFFDKRLLNGTIKLNRLALLILFDEVAYSIDGQDDYSSVQELYRYFKIEGVWTDHQNENILYEIQWFAHEYNMTVYELYETEIKYTNYIVIILLDDDGYMFCTVHPRGRAKNVQNIKIGPLDSSYHYLTFDNYEFPTEIRLTDKERHPNYDFNINNLYRASQEQTDYLYKKLETVKQVDKFEKYKSEYIYDSRIYAITPDYIYIIPPAPDNDVLYKISRIKYIDNDILRITVDDTGGFAVLAQKGPYIGFEKIGLYIDISSDEKIQEAEIEIVGFDEIR